MGENPLVYYNNNYIHAYHFIMNPYVPSCTIFSGLIGIFICVLLWKLIYDEIHNIASIIQPDIRNVLVAFTFTNTIGQFVAVASSILFLKDYELLYPDSSSYNNNGARFLGMMFIWIRLANSFLILIMLLKSISKKKFYLWNQVIFYSVFGPLFVSLYAVFSDITGFSFSQLLLGSCSIVMVPKLPTFITCVVWVYTIEVLDFFIFVLNCIFIINIRLKNKKFLEEESIIRSINAVVPNTKYLLIYVSSVIMIAKSVEVLRIITVSFMFYDMGEHRAKPLGIFNMSLLIFQAVLECAQPVLTYAIVKTFLNRQPNFFYFLKPPIKNYPENDLI